LLPLRCCRVIAAALQPVKHKLQESSKFVRHYVAAQKARAPAPLSPVQLLGVGAQQRCR
jgi:hypothetical protein